MNLLPEGLHPTALNPARAWRLPLVAWLAATLVAWSETNQALFLLVNGLAAHLPGGFWQWVTVTGDTLLAFAILLPLDRRQTWLRGRGAQLFALGLLLGAAWIFIDFDSGYPAARRWELAVGFAGIVLSFRPRGSGIGNQESERMDGGRA